MEWQPTEPAQIEISMLQMGGPDGPVIARLPVGITPTPSEVNALVSAYVAEERTLTEEESITALVYRIIDNVMSET